MLYILCTLGVTSLDEYVKKVQKFGGIIALPKMATPGVGWLAYMKDLEGNIFGMMERNKEAGIV